MKTKIRVEFTFVAIIALFTVFDTTGFAILGLCAGVVHELGHLAAMWLSGVKVKSIFFRGGGIQIEPEEKGKITLFILSAGSIANFLTFAVIFTALERPFSYLYPLLFSLMNVCVGMFNLLPIGCMDGKQILERLLPPRMHYALRILEIALILVLSGAVIVALYHGFFNFTVIAAMVYVILVDLHKKLCYNI